MKLLGATLSLILVQMKLLWKTRNASLILSDGMPRSGSTYLYNIVRACCEEKYGTDFACGWIGDFHKWDKHQAYLVKAHGTSPFLRKRCQVIFYSYRDVRDTMVSAHRKFQTPMSLAYCRTVIADDLRSKQDADCIVKYEEMIARPEQTVQQVAQTLGVDVTPEEILKNVPGAFDEGAENERYNEVTLLHGKHGTGTESGSWRNVMDPELQQQINREFAGWFQRHEYDPY